MRRAFAWQRQCDGEATARRNVVGVQQLDAVRRAGVLLWHGLPRNDAHHHLDLAKSRYLRNGDQHLPT